MAEKVVAQMEAGFSRSLRTACSQLAGFATNKVKIEPQGANKDARAGSKISFALPSNSLLNLRSISLVMPKVSTTSDASCVALIPLASDLIQQCTVYLNGVALTMNSSQWDTISRVVGLTNKNKDQNETCARNEGSDMYAGTGGLAAVLNNGEGFAKALVYNNIIGFPSQSSVRYCDTSLTGDLRIEFVLAPNYNLYYTNNSTTLGVGDAFGGAAQPSQLSYNVEEFYMTAEVISINGGLYSELQRAKIMEQEFIQMNYKDYVSLEADGATHAHNTTRFSASSQSIDWLYATMRDSTYAEYPTSGDFNYFLPISTSHALGGPTTNNDRLSELGVLIPKTKFFRSMSDGPQAPTVGGQPGNPLWVTDYHTSTQSPCGTFGVQFRVNGVAHPQVPNDEISAYLDTCLKGLDEKQNRKGNIIHGQHAFRYGQYVACCRLSQEPDTDSEMEVARVTGFNSRNINTDFQVVHTGLNNGSKSVFVVAEMTSSIRIGAGKSVARVP